MKVNGEVKLKNLKTRFFFFTCLSFGGGYLAEARSHKLLKLQTVLWVDLVFVPFWWDSDQKMA